MSLLTPPLATLLRRRYHGLYLGVHQMLVVTAIVCLWFHTLRSSGTIPKIYIITTGSVFLITKLINTLWFLLNNYRWAPIELSIRRDGVRDSEDGIRKDARSQDQITLRLSFSGRMKIKAGQHISLYIPALTGLHGHLLPVSWWSHEQRMSIDIMLDPGHRPAQTLAKHDQSTPRAYLTGPHGSPTAMDDYGTVLLVATGQGISTQLYHIKQLIKARDNGTSRTRHIHLVWEFDTWGKVLSECQGTSLTLTDDFILEAQSRLTELLDEDRSMSSHVDSLTRLQKLEQNTAAAPKPEYLRSLDEVIKRSSHVGHSAKDPLHTDVTRPLQSPCTWSTNVLPIRPAFEARAKTVNTYGCTSIMGPFHFTILYLQRFETGKGRFLLPVGSIRSGRVYANFYQCLRLIPPVIRFDISSVRICVLVWTTWNWNINRWSRNIRNRS